ncbi:MAG: hypothetical protein GDA40_02695 [Rhodobacteraceae bacterium]|nr:hypothetical protein [Paracoccaceae bacterium]
MQCAHSDSARESGTETLQDREKIISRPERDFFRSELGLPSDYDYAALYLYREHAGASDLPVVLGVITALDDMPDPNIGRAIYRGAAVGEYREGKEPTLRYTAGKSEITVDFTNNRVDVLLHGFASVTDPKTDLPAIDWNQIESIMVKGMTIAGNAFHQDKDTKITILRDYNMPINRSHTTPIDTAFGHFYGYNLEAEMPAEIGGTILSAVHHGEAYFWQFLGCLPPPPTEPEQPGVPAHCAR